jgi:hypothetical protein
MRKFILQFICLGLLFLPQLSFACEWNIELVNKHTGLVTHYIQNESGIPLSINDAKIGIAVKCLLMFDKVEPKKPDINYYLNKVTFSCMYPDKQNFVTDASAIIDTQTRKPLAGDSTTIMFSNNLVTKGNDKSGIIFLKAKCK